MSDIWSLGLVMLECATGNFPYPPRESFYELLEAVVDQPSPSAPADQFSAEFCSFVSAWYLCFSIDTPLLITVTIFAICVDLNEELSYKYHKCFFCLLLVK